VDAAKGSWGIIAADHFIATTDAEPTFPPGGNQDGSGGLVAHPTMPGVMLPRGVKVAVAADWKDQQTISPTALSVDEQNNIHLAETHRFRFGVEDDLDHPYWVVDDTRSQSTADRRKMYEKWAAKMPLEKLTAKAELVRKLSDKDGDGHYETSTVFSGGYNDALDGTGSGVFSLEGTTYFACIPKIWALKDADGDGVAESKEALFDGFGVKVSISGHDLNGFALGPDGRIYGTCGDRGMSVTTKEGRKFHYPDEGVAFRFEPDGSGFEVFHRGLRNPKEIAFDRLGNPFTVDNNCGLGDASRVVYLMEGGDSGWRTGHQMLMSFHRELGMEKRPPIQWVTEGLWKTPHAGQPAFVLPAAGYLTSGPSGVTYHPGTGFVESEAGHFHVCDYRGGGTNSGVFSFEMKPKGAGMEMIRSRRLIWGVGATDVEYSYDGRLLIADFMDGWTSHQKGRVLALSGENGTWRAEEAKEAARLVKEGFAKMPSTEVAGWLGHADLRVRMRAQIALARRADGLGILAGNAASEDATLRIHGLWGLGIIARKGITGAAADVRAEAVKRLLPFLSHADEETRLQTLRTLAQAGTTGDGIPFPTLLEDPSVRVRAEAALTLARTSGGNATADMELVRNLLKKNAGEDAWLRYAGIYALEGLAKKGADLSTAAADASADVRQAAVVAMRRTGHAGIAKMVKDASPAVAEEAIRAICDEDMVAHRPVVAALLDEVALSPRPPYLMRRLLHNAFRLGDATNLKRVLAVAGDKSQPAEVRTEAIRLVTTWADALTNDQLTGYYRPRPAPEMSVIVSTLNAALPDLLQQDGLMLTAALGFMEHYKLDPAALDEANLRRITKDTALPTPARAKALDLLVARKPGDLAEFLSTVAEDGAEEVSSAAVGHLTRVSPDAATSLLEKMVEGTDALRMQRAWAILASLPGSRADGLFVKHLATLKEAEGKSPGGIELLEAAGKRTAAPVKDALAAYHTAISASKDPLAKWNVCLEGGDITRGQTLFTNHPAGQCMRCHRTSYENQGGETGTAGPNLAATGKQHDSRYLLEAIVQPSARIAPGFGAISVSFKNGATLGGFLEGDGPEHLDISADGKIWRVQKADLTEVPSPVSTMPPMEHILKPAEVRDLVAWLGTLKKDAPTATPKPAPQPYVPGAPAGK
jgi:quinoprotein glucose dehydrogenase